MGARFGSKAQLVKGPPSTSYFLCIHRNGNCRSLTWLHLAIFRLAVSAGICSVSLRYRCDISSNRRDVFALRWLSPLLRALHLWGLSKNKKGGIKRAPEVGFAYGVHEQGGIDETVMWVRVFMLCDACRNPRCADYFISGTDTHTRWRECRHSCTNYLSHGL
jgi:hypothetical protein